MKIPIILTSTKGKSKEELAKEIIKATKNFFKVKERADQKLAPKSSPNTENKYRAILVPENEQEDKPKEYLLIIFDDKEQIRNAFRLTRDEMSAVIVLMIDLIKNTEHK